MPHADLSKLNDAGKSQARWVLGFGAGTLVVSGAFRPNRERELVEAGVLIPTGNPGEFTVGTSDDTCT